MSQNTLTAPNMAAGSVEEMKVMSGANTASPSPTPSAMKASWSASVPLAQVMQCLRPVKAASCASSSFT